MPVQYTVEQVDWRHLVRLDVLQVVSAEAAWMALEPFSAALVLMTATAHSQQLTTIVKIIIIITIISHRAQTVHRPVQNIKVNSAFHPARVGKSSTGLYSWGKGRGVYLCQVTLCDPIWQVTLCSSNTGFSIRAIHHLLPWKNL